MRLGLTPSCSAALQTASFLFLPEQLINLIDCSVPRQLKQEGLGSFISAVHGTNAELRFEKSSVTTQHGL